MINQSSLLTIRKGETTQRDAIYQAIFGEGYPNTDEDGNQGGVEG